MPTPERNRYSNKESVKVNAGLDFGGFVDANGPGAETSDNQWTSNRPVMDMDFSLLTLPPVVPEAKSTIEQLVVRLLDPPPHAFPHGTLSIQWVIGAVGMAHLAFRNRDERYVLGQDSGLRNQGLGLGIPVAYLEWLCGDEEATSSEQGMCLTRAFFMELER
ncbi:hypothetical protein EJ02DRAFT_360917 [Clathrospora elynae]|uniref:Uncharacterized protein n=1 Tax=Clathrospora elynae TaxID=706981 RepID=A0A6A5S7E8_9PLEO|nr:hypothetical protein EJ02DRAFT_360917 [Clathrospora elynae]